LFVEQGEDGAGEIEKVKTRLKKIEAEITKKFPITNAQTTDFRAELREHVLGIAEVEKKAIEILQDVMH
jgi:2'-5' RNA ligase